jgi:CHASE2 domain-containing sensor protein
LAKPPLRGFENQLTDLAFQTRTLNPAFTDLTPDDVVIIDIDDASIAELGRPQQWPRLYDARAIAHVAAGNPFAIGIDYLYTEADSLLPVYGELLNRSGFSRADSILSAMRTDDSLAIAIRSAGNVYLALFDNETGSGNSGYAHLRRLSAEGETLKNAPILNDPVLPHTPFAAAARANGTIAMPSENDGTVRYYQLVSQAGDGFVANFPFYMVTDAFGFTDEELKRLDQFVRANTVDRFGPVRVVRADATFGLVVEVAFEGLQRSPRHKSGLAMRFPRIHRIRWDKPSAEADRIETLQALL